MENPLKTKSKKPAERPKGFCPKCGQGTFDFGPTYNYEYDMLRWLCGVCKYEVLAPCAEA